MQWIVSIGEHCDPLDSDHRFFENLHSFAALEAVMTQVPMSHATPGFKAHLAEVILQAAAQGVTSYDGLVAAASDQIQTIISMLT
jgi:hypothetical protein